MAAYLKKPDWLRVQYNREAVEEVARLMKDLKLNTVCKEANCPNLGECYKKHTATFMVMAAPARATAASATFRAQSRSRSTRTSRGILPRSRKSSPCGTLW